MAPNKPDEVEEAKKEITKGARVVGEAAKNVSSLSSRLERLFSADHWGEIGEEINDLDAEFSKEETMMPNPRDIRPERIITGIHQTRISREDALKILGHILPGFNSGSSFGRDTANSIRRMEEALAEGDKILEHWKK
jgi:hypothetical protein